MKQRSLALVAVYATAHCSSCDTVSPTDGGGDAAVDTPSEALPDVAPCTPAPRPSYVPLGWIPYDDYAPCSGLYVPTAASQLPPPIDWQQCESVAGVAGCRRIQLDWSPLPSGALGTDSDVAVDASGSPIVITSRSFAYGATVNLVAAADGPVYSAVMATQLNQFATAGFLPPAFAPPRWIIGVIENGSSKGGGYLAGTIVGVGPTQQHRFPATADHEEAIGTLGVLDVASNSYATLLDFSTGSKLLDINTPSLSMSFEWMFQSTVFWQGNAGLVNDVGRWTPDGGAIDFINYGFDPTHVAGDLGTDGTDMVWLEGHGSQTDAGPYTTVDYWTSPFTLDPAQLTPRRLRSETTTAILGTPIAVGCGYAAYAPVGNINGMRVVRISDGWSWYLPNATGWYWQQALTVRCNEVFARVNVAGPITTLARVALNQLGAGVPPD